VRLQRHPLDRPDGEVYIQPGSVKMPRPQEFDVDAGVFGFEQIDLGATTLSVGVRYDHRSLDVDADSDLGLAAQTRRFDSVTGNLGGLDRVSKPVAGPSTSGAASGRPPTSNCTRTTSMKGPSPSNAAIRTSRTSSR
jgi:hypothetical protein